MDWQEFVDTEQDTFIGEYFSRDYVPHFFPDDEVPEEVPQTVKTSISQGVDDFLQTQKDGVESLYHASLSDFFYDDSTQKRVQAELESLSISNADGLALDVSRSYATFVINDSYGRFYELLGQESASSRT